MKEIELDKGYVALIDDEDYYLVSLYDWYALIPKTRHTVYAIAQVKKPHPTIIYMHCLVMNAIGIDHRDANGLNNQRYNLRVATQSQNLGNMRKTRGKSKYKGVVSIRGLWQAQIGHEGKCLFLGRYLTEEEAALAYNARAFEKWGEFARLNEVT